ncbi:oxysterol-binding protein-related protein 6-like [Watersipora subatra]|uniref:oxysterol-binding protein-related protein 6-like n=1 Tax=Watersipora subatra TaxID=2589382 RepID=UPI00355BD84B
MASETKVKSSDYKSKHLHRNKSEWEVVGGLREGDVYEERPNKFDGYLHKKRNPPLKGWHRRYFVLEEGMLTYSKSPNDHLKRRHHGKINIALSVISFNPRQKKIDIDADDFVCHIRTKNQKWFDEWIQNLRNHRLFRQNELNYGTDHKPLMTRVKAEEESSASGTHSITTGTPFVSNENLKRMRAGSLRGNSMQSQGKVLAWLIDNDSSEQCEKDLSKIQEEVAELESTIERLEVNLPLAFHSSELSPQITTETHKRGSISKILSFKSTHKRERKLIETANGKNSSSNPSISTKFTLGETERPERPSSLGLYREPIQELKLCSEFVNRSRQVYSLLKNLSKRIGVERDRIKHAVQDSSLGAAHSQNNEVYIYALKQCIQEYCKQNEELKMRLQQCGGMVVTENVTEGFSKISLPPSPTQEKRNSLLRSNVNRSHSLSSKASDMFYDAEEGTNDDAASTVSSDSSSSSFSDHEVETGMSEEMVIDDRESLLSDMYHTGRRSTLPAPMSLNDSGLFSILSKNIGKDLTRISMPVTLNEPLNTLQLMCEELEYSDLLDKAASFSDPYERMAYVAAFAVSSYASCNTRAATKPFNPILGETYECIRLDKGWKFVAEQVSHHPPISVCHADSQNFIFKQDCRAKTKFWGKSMEVHPVGGISVYLPGHDETYKWKKVTACVHNVLAGQRWVDQYGEMNISCKDVICKLTFVKASYWSNKKHEVHGTVTGPDGEVQIYLFGKWTEALYCKTDEQANRCIWRAGNMPEDCELYYGFTRFAIELNELREEESSYLPRTDTRFRPDQRMLEEGMIEQAESEKQRVEKLQREARKIRESSGSGYQPRWFRKVEHDKKESYMFTEEYWKCKREPGFNALDDIPRLW